MVEFRMLGQIDEEGLGLAPVIIGAIISGAIGLAQQGWSYHQATKQAMEANLAHRELVDQEMRSIAWGLYEQFPDLSYPNWYDIVRYEYANYKASEVPLPPPDIPSGPNRTWLWIAVIGAVGVVILAASRR